MDILRGVAIVTLLLALACRGGGNDSVGPAPSGPHRVLAISALPKHYPNPTLADFITSGFTTWASLGAAKLPFLNVFLLHDFDQASVDTFASFYGLPRDAGFKAYLATLGLRKNDGTPKQGWTALVQGSAATGLP